MQTLTVGKNDAGQRLDRFLSKTLTGLPNSLLYKYFRLKSFRVNGVRAKQDTVVHEGDVVSLYIRDEFLPSADAREAKSRKYAFERLTLKDNEIVYEDAHILIVDKPQGETVHSMSEAEAASYGEAKTENSYLIDRVLGYLCKKGEYDPENEQSFTPALCHRLDRNTGGLLVCAKDAESLRIMNQKIKDRELKKQYYCETEGVPKQKEAVLEAYQVKDSENKRVFVYATREEAKRRIGTKYDDDIKRIVTAYRVVKTRGNNALLSVDLVTGRTHQIRAHLAYIGCPLVGDSKYGVNHDRRRGANYQHLYAYRLTFAFSTPSGCLEYLAGKTFTGQGASFLEPYLPL